MNTTPEPDDPQSAGTEVFEFASDPNDVEFLYEFVRENKPACILEFGSGMSTLAMARAQNENGYGLTFSFESEPYWYHRAEDMLGLLTNVSLQYAPLFILDTFGEPGFRYWGFNFRDAVPDMLYVDGPALPEGGPYITFNPIDYRPKWIIIDGREKTAAFLAAHMRGYLVDSDHNARRTIMARVDA